MANFYFPFKDRLKEVSEKAVSDAREIVFEQEQPTMRARYALRGGKLFALLAIFFVLATICVASKLFLGERD